MSSILHKIRNRIFSPGSHLELQFRTLYHRLNSSRLAFLVKDRRSKRSYRRNGEFPIYSSPSLTKNPFDGTAVSFLLSVRKGEEKASLRTIQSILDLSNEAWELVLLVPDGSCKELITKSVEPESRLVFRVGRELKVSELAGEYLVFCQPGDIFSQTILKTFYDFYTDYPDLNGYYYDCEYLREDSRLPLPLCKPMSVSTDALLSVNLLSRAFFRKTFVLSNTSDRISFDFTSVEYGLALCAAQTPDQLYHLPEVLLRQETLMQPASQEVVQIITSHLESLGLMDVTFEVISSQPHFSWAKQENQVAIIIPTKDHYYLLKTLLESLELTTYQDYCIYLVDNGSTDVETLAFYNTLLTRQNVRIIPYNEPFNYSKAVNLGAAESESDLLLFLNDDMQIIHPDWLGELVQWVQQPEIGVVGTKLLRKNRTIQHAGIVIGINDFVGHIYLNAPEHYTGLFGSVDWVRNYLAVTGACQMVRRSVFEEVQGYDEDFRLAFGDIDFCLKVHGQGYRNVYTPFANLFHLEGKSRGFATPIEDIQKGYEKLGAKILTPDSNYSERLSLSVIPHYLTGVISLEERKRNLEERQSFYFQ